MSATESLPDDHLRITYNEVHLLLRDVAQRVKKHCPPDIIVAIGGGGFFPARVLRTFLKVPSRVDPSKMRSLPIQAIGLSLYEEVAGTSAEQMGTEVVRTQWLDHRQIAGQGQKKGQEPAAGKVEEGKDAGGLLGKNILIVDEVDDSRTTLQYAYAELLKDVRQALAALPESVRATLPPTRFAIAVVHNKKKDKKGSLPILDPERFTGEEQFDDGVGTGVWYFAGETIEGDRWVNYPWEQEDIIEHDRLAALARRLEKSETS
ncbi:unnamed protein product [Tilletia controversa]|uniref:Xanthine phosphoribosyltransferase 1 n=3 Tax=Tilletia TaxID=13289 RepID=A0A8X7MVX2_9BASI|nr:hypothetical protein CF336_g2473 [Tilletia laevis]KAE8202335.1 hypothetical protein CF328_g2271 [Tilletia controversa]KAE8263089.1 hypothetical protein A4X03_0g1941 [Tilletia caries]KAE8199843.1 hypothetical protein CF335_g4076 [Tilletia laevis]KAE8251157.1 hypothetical protein A4X06_0g2791 [Tilletia controversa]